MIFMSSSFRRRQRPRGKDEVVREHKKLKVDGVEGKRSTCQHDSHVHLITFFLP